MKFFFYNREVRVIEAILCSWRKPIISETLGRKETGRGTNFFWVPTMCQKLHPHDLVWYWDPPVWVLVSFSGQEIRIRWLLYRAHSWQVGPCSPSSWQLLSTPPRAVSPAANQRLLSTSWSPTVCVLQREATLSYKQGASYKCLSFTKYIFIKANARFLEGRYSLKIKVSM